MIKSLNSASSQVWAFILVVLGIASLVIACFCHSGSPAVAVLLTNGGTMIGGGIGMFQHQTASEKQTNPPPAIDPPAAVPVAVQAEPAPKS